MASASRTGGSDVKRLGITGTDDASRAVFCPIEGPVLAVAAILLLL